MVEDNSVPKRLRELELKVASHIAECDHMTESMTELTRTTNGAFRDINRGLNDLNGKLAIVKQTAEITKSRVTWAVGIAVAVITALSAVAIAVVKSGG